MSRTLKRYPEGCLRNPRGHKQAAIRGERSVPPHSWEDIGHDKQCWLPFKIATGMAKALVEKEKIIEHLMKKCKIRRGQAEMIAELTGRVRNRSPEGCLAIAKEKVNRE
jgi:hypothetical protein